MLLLCLDESRFSVHYSGKTGAKSTLQYTGVLGSVILSATFGLATSFQGSDGNIDSYGIKS